MKVREVMTRDVEVVRPDTSIQQAAEKMKEHDIGPLPVCENDRLVGMITDRDIAVRSTSDGHDPRTDHVRNIMTPDILYCFEDDDVNEAARIMKEGQVRRLVVLDRDKRLVGIVSLGDLAVSSGDEQLTGSTLEGVSQPAGANH